MIPTGWRLPWASSWHGFTTVLFKWDSVNECYIYSGVTPSNNWLFCGYRSDILGDLSGSISIGYWWSGGCNSGGSAYNLSLTKVSHPYLSA